MSFARKWIPILVASIVGLLVLLGSLLQTNRWLARLRTVLVDWATIVAACAFLLGALNIFKVHGGRVVRLRKGWGYSLILLLAAVATGLVAAIQGPSAGVTQMAYNAVIVPVGAALAALVLFALVLAAFRMVRVRREAASFLFVLVVVVALLGNTPLLKWGWLTQPPRDWAVNVFGLAGMRGLLLGVALGTVTTALRATLLGDWPHEH